MTDIQTLAARCRNQEVAALGDAQGPNDIGLWEKFLSMLSPADFAKLAAMSDPELYTFFMEEVEESTDFHDEIMASWFAAEGEYYDIH